MFGKLFGGQQSNADANAAAVQQQQAQPQQQQQVEFPPFQTLSKGPVYDLRFYEPYPVVEMDYRRRENGYLTLGGYFKPLGGQQDSCTDITMFMVWPV